MTAAAAQIEPLAGQLVEALDETIALQQEVIAQLKGLSDGMLSRDSAAAERLMDGLGTIVPRLEAAAQQRAALRSQLALAMDCPVGDVTLRRLGRDLPPPLSGAVAARQERLRDLAEALRAGHLRTAVRLSEVARVNRAILGDLFPGRHDDRMYRTDGRTRWLGGYGLLDARS